MNTMSGIRYAVPWPSQHSRVEVEDWCRELCGEPGFKERWMFLDYTIQFRNKSDRDWFILRWGS